MRLHLTEGGDDALDGASPALSFFGPTVRLIRFVRNGFGEGLVFEEGSLISSAPPSASPSLPWEEANDVTKAKRDGRTKQHRLPTKCMTNPSVDCIIERPKSN